MATSDAAVLATGLTKRYGETVALDGLDLAVLRGSVLGLLGPNGAGKTTMVRILATLQPADGGVAEVDGLDVASRPRKVRERIALTGQYAAVDQHLTGAENLVMIGRLTGLRKRDAVRRAGELLATFELTEAADRPSRTYSGGMRRRLDLAAALVARPRVLFLDEPTTGLDPASRRSLWAGISDIVADGTSVLLTTQYLEEADVLADRVLVIDHGRALAEGTTDELKARVGGERIEFTVVEAARARAAADLVRPHAAGAVATDADKGHVSFPVDSSDPHLLARVVHALDDAGIAVHELSLRRASLDDVFLALTGRTADEGTAADHEERRP